METVSIIILWCCFTITVPAGLLVGKVSYDIDLDLLKAILVGIGCFLALFVTMSIFFILLAKLLINIFG